VVHVRRDLVCAAAGLALAGAYYAAADALPASLLADGVGAGGIPKLLAVALVLLSLLLGARSLLLRAGTTEGARGPHLRALGVAGLALAYVAAAPWLGYPLALALLVAAATLYYGARPRPGVFLYAIGCAALLWLVFAKLLGVAMPPGLWWR
jgi:hypothetical protein